MDPAGIAEGLNRALALLRDSFMIYLQDVANPVLAPEDGKVGDLLARMADEDRAFIGEIADLIERSGGAVEPHLLSLSAVSYHYLAVDYLLPICAAKGREGLEAFRRVTAQLAEHPEIHAVLSRIADAKARHLEQIEGALSKN